MDICFENIHEYLNIIEIYLNRKGKWYIEKNYRLVMFRFSPLWMW